MVTTRIGTVTDVPGQGARTPEEYRALQAKRIAQRRRCPGLESLYVHEDDTPIDAYITLGIWRMRCVCGEAPSTHPAWGLACCAGCGAVWTNVQFPEDRQAIEAVLVKRARARDRNWIAAWTAADLSRQNVTHGDPA